MGCVSKKRIIPSFISESIQDGGYLGWVAVLGTFSTWMSWVGTTKCLAIMLPTLQDQFNTSTWIMGWMIAIVDASAELVGPFASPLKERFGLRVVVMVSGLFAGAAFIVSSFASRLPVMTVLLALFAGPAFGVSNIVTREMIGRSFSNSYTLAFGIAGFGSSLAFLTFAPLSQFFLDLYGWRGTLMLIGAIVLHLAVCGALLKPAATPAGRTGDYQAVAMVVAEGAEAERAEAERAEAEGAENEGAEAEGAAAEAAIETCSRCPCFSSVFVSIGRTVHFELFTSISYWLVVFISVLSMTMHSAWVIYFVPYTYISKGFPLSDCTNFVIVYGIGKLIGNFTVGILARTLGATGTNVLMGMSIIVPSINLLVDPWLVSIVSIKANAFIYGFFVTCFYILLDVITKEAVGVELLGNALGWIALKAGTVRFLFLFFPGLIYDTLGSYTLAFILMGGINALTTVALLALIWLQRRRRD